MSKPKPILVYPLYSPNVATDVDLATEVSNTDLLGIISKHTAAGFTATIIVRTS